MNTPSTTFCCDCGAEFFNAPGDSLCAPCAHELDKECYDYSHDDFDEWEADEIRDEMRDVYPAPNCNHDYSPCGCDLYGPQDIRATTTEYLPEIDMDAPF